MLGGLKQTIVGLHSTVGDPSPHEGNHSAPVPEDLATQALDWNEIAGRLLDIYRSETRARS